MRSVLLGFVVLIALPLVGCASAEPPPPIQAKVTVNLRPEGVFRKKGVADIPGPPEQEAILAVLVAETAGLEAAAASLTETAQPTAVAKALDQYTQSLDKIDVKECPPNFSKAFVAYRKACRKLHDAIKPLPDQYTGTEFLDSLGAAMKGQTTKAQPLGGDVMTAARNLNQTFEEVCNQNRINGVEVIR